MKNYIVIAFIFLASTMGFAQPNQMWRGFFSYNHIVELAQSETSLFAAAENSLFKKNLATEVLSTTTTIDGLSGEMISAMHHSSEFNKTFIGYQSGLMIIINENDGSMLKVVDILNKNIPTNIKRINHYNEFEGILYISCDFGIVQYNIATLGFGDTYFIGSGVAEIVVKQTAVHDGYIYAATRDFGVKRALVTNPNLIDANQWTMIAAGNYAAVESFGANLIAATTGGQLQRLNGSTFQFFTQLSDVTIDLRATDSYLVATVPGRVTIFDELLNSTTQFNNWQIPDIFSSFTAATVIGQTIYIGTLAHGVITTEIMNPSAQETLLPEGPLRNSIFSINASTENLWAVYGGYSFSLTPFYSQQAFSKFNSTGWKHIPYEDFQPTGGQIYDLVRVTVHPDNSNKIFVSSYFHGLLEFENDELVTIYNATNSSMEPIFATDPPESNIRVNQTAFDNDGNLWGSVALVKNALVVMRANGTWDAVNIEEVISDYLSSFYTQMVIDKNNTVWVGTFNHGVLAFNEDGSIFKKIRMGNDVGNLPSERVRSLAIDNRNQLWIGTDKGLRVLPSVDRFNSDDQMTTNPIIIVEEDLAQELLFEQFVSDIVVDGSNNKWLGTSDSGLYMVSPNGQETKYHFTADNSPLPSNSIQDLDINGTTGEVFVVTSKGMVSFKGISTDPKDNLNNVVVYPNPVRPDFFGTVKITGLIDKATIKITDIEGNLVYEVVSEGGTIEWDTTAFGKYRVASGVYMIFISAEDATETKVKKVMIIR